MAQADIEIAKEKEKARRIGEAYDLCQEMGKEMGRHMAVLYRSRTIEPTQAEGFRDYLAGAFEEGLKSGMVQELFKEKRPATPVTPPVNQAKQTLAVLEKSYDVTTEFTPSNTVIDYSQDVVYPEVDDDDEEEDVDDEPMVEEEETVPQTESESQAPPPSPPMPSIESLPAPPIPTGIPPILAPKKSIRYIGKDGKVKYEKNRDPTLFPGNYQAECACGCGTLIWKFTVDGVERSWAHGHNPTSSNFTNFRKKTEKERYFVRKGEVIDRMREPKLVKCACGCGEDILDWNPRMLKEVRYKKNHHLRVMNKSINDKAAERRAEVESIKAMGASPNPTE